MSSPSVAAWMRRDPPGRAATLRIGLLVLGLSMGAYAAVRQAEFGDRLPVLVSADLVAGWAFLVAGTIAWSRRPDNRIGPLLVAVGFTWFVGSYGRLGTEATSHLARSLQGFYEPLLAWIVLAYPGGRLRSRASRLVVGAWLFDHAAWSIARLVLARPLSWYGCVTCRETVDAYVANTNTLQAIGPISLALTVGFAMAVIAILLVRLARTGPAGRRREGPAIVAGLALGASVAVTGAIRIGVDPSLFSDPRVGAATYVLDMLVAVAVLAGLLHDRLAREAAADLVSRLERLPRGDQAGMRDALAAALGDPGLRVLTPDGLDGYRDSSGAAAVVEAGWGDDRVTMVTGPGEGADPLAIIVHEPGLLEDPSLRAAVSAALRLDIENRRLTEEVERQLADVRASRTRIVAAGDAERRRVERDLHDGAQQRLLSLSMELGRLRAAADRSGDEGLADALGELARSLESTIAELRELARGILPGILADAGLPAAIESLALRAPLPVTATVEIADRLPAAVESTAYFVVAEALTNVARHAAARTARIEVVRRDGRLEVTVEDDGIGGAGGRGTMGSGLQGLEDRVGALGGHLAVETPAGGGTRVRAVIPIEP